MAQAHNACVVEGAVRSASFWRACGFAVPLGVPGDALGVLKDGKIMFTWELP